MYNTMCQKHINPKDIVSSSEQFNNQNMYSVCLLAVIFIPKIQKEMMIWQNTKKDQMEDTTQR